VGARRGGEDVGSAIKTDVRVVESGIEAERRARRAVWRRCGRRVRLYEYVSAGWMHARKQVLVVQC
jgi:hypothetical protein